VCFFAWYPCEGYEGFNAIRSGRWALFAKGAKCMRPRELLEPLERGPLGVYFGRSFPCVGIGDCYFIV